MAELQTDPKALLDANNVPDRFQYFLKNNGCLSVLAFASTAAEEKLLKEELITPSGITDLTFGENLAIKVAWKQARGATDGKQGTSSGKNSADA